MDRLRPHRALRVSQVDDNFKKRKCKNEEGHTAPMTLAFEEVESTLINFVHDLRAKCNTLRIALPNVDAGTLNDF